MLLVGFRETAQLCWQFFQCHRLTDPLQYQSIVDAEWNIIYDKLDKCVKSGAKVVLSRLAIGDLGTQVLVLTYILARLYRLKNRSYPEENHEACNH